MKKGKIRFKICCLLLFLFAPCITVNAVGEEFGVIRVGFYEMEGFQYLDEYGNETGYNIDYLNALALLTGWEYQYIDVKDFANGMDMLERKQIDLLAPSMKTEERRTRFQFSDLSFGTEYSVLVTNKDSDRFFYEDFQSFNGMRVAVVSNYPLTDFFGDYMKKNRFGTKYVYYDTPDAALTALKNGFVDGAVTSLLAIDDSYKVLARFSPMPFYYMTYKGNDELIERLNDSMQDVQNTYPGLQAELMATHFPKYNQQFFTRDDREYIDSIDSVKVGYIQGRLPISYMDENGELAGVSREIFDRISEISGIKFEYVALPYGPITYSYLDENNIDIITGVEDNSSNRSISSMVMSAPYFTSSKVMVGHSDFVYSRTKPIKLCITSGSQTLKSKLKKQYPNFEIIEYGSINECFDAVRSRQADLLIQNQYVVENWLARPQYEALHTVAMDGVEDALCFATTASKKDGVWKKTNKDIRLIRIINKTLSQITDEEMETFLVHETLETRYEYTFLDFLYRYRATVMAVAMTVVVGLIAGMYVIHLRRRTKATEKRERTNLLIQQKRYQIIMDHAKEMMYEISLRHDACFSSEGIKQKFGWEIPSQVDNIRLEDLGDILHVHPEDIDIFLGNEADDEEWTEHECVVRLKCVDNEYIWCKVTKYPIYDDNHQIISIVGRIEDVDEDTKEKALLRKQSRIDDLSGLLNKRTFIKETRTYLQKHSAKNSGFIFVDMDHFKELNDNLGHSVGDIAIKDTANKLQVIFANYDLVARFGGDEFCVFVKNIPMETLVDKLNFALDKLKATYENEACIVKLTASIGAAYCFVDKIDYETLLECADTAVYEAKKLGRNQFVINELYE